MDLAAGARAGSLERGANFGGVMAVIVDHGHAARLTAVLEAPVDAAKILEPLGDLFRRYFKLPGDRDGGRGVEHIVPAGNLQLEGAERALGGVYLETRKGNALPRARFRAKSGFGAGRLHRAQIGI